MITLKIFLKKKLKHLSDEPVPEIVFINAANFLKKAEKKYIVNPGASHIYRGKIKLLFAEHVINKAKNGNWKLNYISRKNFHSQFIEEETKLYGLEIRRGK